MASEDDVSTMLQRLSNEDPAEHNLFRLSSGSEMGGGSPPARTFHQRHQKPLQRSADTNQPLNHALLAPGFTSAVMNELNHPPHFMRQASNTKPCNPSPAGPHTNPSRGASPPATLSNTLFISADTDPYHAASMLVAILTQPSHAHSSNTHAVLHIASPLSEAHPHPSQQPSELQLEQLMSAARAVLSIIVLANQEISSNHSQPCDMAFVPFMSPAASAGGSVSVLVISTGQRAAVFHGPGSVQILVSSSNNLQLKSQEITAVVGSGAQADVFYDSADALLLLQTVLLSRWSLQGSGQDVLLLPVSVSQVKLVQVSHVLSAKLMQQLAALVKQQEQALGVGQASGSPPMGQAAAGSRRTSDKEAATDAMQQNGTPSFNLSQSIKLSAPASGSPPPTQELYQPMVGNIIAAALASMSAQQQQQQQQGSIAAAASMPTQHQQQQQHAPLQHQQQQHAPLQQQQQQQHGQGQRSHQQRVRKADYVIVTEDTAIKNAAGAIAKVLGRVCDQGHCCPVYTERKTGQPTGVISVAVKAITVARGYVDNEGQRHQVAFQPYLRMQSAGGGGPAQDASRPYERRSPEALLGGGSGGGGGSVLLRSADNSASAPTDSSLDDECSELAFDVFKVPPGQLPDVAEDSNVPVKVTAHSRANVVSNIITKLVLDHNSAVLITAGGPAMRVAMRAVVAARCRLKANRCVSDVLLVPQFVTVDTKNTHGWESVFLKFHIVRVPSSLLSSDPQHAPAAAASAAAGPAASSHAHYPLFARGQSHVHQHPEPLLRMSSGGLGGGSHLVHSQQQGAGCPGRGAEPSIFARASEPMLSSALHGGVGGASAHSFMRQSGPAALCISNTHPLQWMGGAFLPDPASHGWPGVN